MITLNNKQNTIQLAEFISKDLIFRDSVTEIFNYINESELSKIFIDFQNIQSITRSFAHQYVITKEQSKKTIINVNMAPNIQRMFELIRKEKILENDKG